LRKAWENSKSYVQPRDSFGTAIKMSAKSGSFNQLVGSMAMFDLIETGGGEIRWTDLAKQIVHGKGDEVVRAKEKATRNITLFGDIYDKFGANFTDDNVRLFLKDNATADYAEANSLAPVVGKLLKKHVQYLTPAKDGGGEPRGMSGQTSGTQTPMQDLIVGQGTLSTPFGTIKLVNQATLDLARKLLDVVEAQMREEQKPKAEPKPKEQSHGRAKTETDALIEAMK
jgi:hypothetical protein